MPKIAYVCSVCENSFGRWLGKCPRCGEFNTIEETTVEEPGKREGTAGLKSGQAAVVTRKTKRIGELKNEPLRRIVTTIGELDRVLGGGFVPGEVVLFAGQPGSGKSTLSLSVANAFAAMGKKVLYSSGEESEHQIGLRANRMHIDNDNIVIVNETSLEQLLGHIEQEKPEFLVVDSLQTIASTEVSGSVGSVGQSREAAHTLTRLAKRKNIVMILINQIVKSGEFAGSEQVQHIVDCSLMLESDVDTPLKFLRASKNRFGDIGEIGCFQHGESGLEQIQDPSGVLLDNELPDSPGTACSFISEGVRQIPVEVQALVSRSILPMPRKQFSGVNAPRAQIVCAILDKFCNAKLYEKDVFISTVAGVRINDPQADLALAGAVLSSGRERAFAKRSLFIGELSLTGLVRGGFMLEQKIREAERLGFEQIIAPKKALERISTTSMATIGVVHIKELLTLLP